MRRAATLVLGSLLIAGVVPLRAQSEAARPDPMAAAGRLLQEGDLEGAVALLEPLREDPQASPVGLAMLGALYLEIGLAREALEILQPLAAGEEANPAVLYNAGRAALQLGDEPAALGYLRRSVERVPVSPAARTLGLLLGGRGEILEAYRLLRPWALANPEDVEAGQAAALCALRLERIPEVEELLQALPEGDPRTALLRADLLLRQRDPKAALSILEPLAAEAPPEMTADVLQLLAKAYLETGRSDDAIALLEPQARGNPQLTLLLGKARYQGGDVTGAVAALEPLAKRLLGRGEALASLPAGVSGSIALEYGRFLIAAERTVEALPPLQLATELNPWSSEAWQQLAQAQMGSGDRQGAEASMERVRKLAEARRQAAVPGLKGRARLEDLTGRRLSEALEWLGRGEPQRALDITRQEIALVPDDLRPRLLEVRLLLEAGRQQEAAAAAEAAVELHPDDADALHFRAVARLALGEVEAAEEDLRRALELAPRHLPAMSDLALVLAGRGELEEARALLERAAALDPDDELVRRRLEALGGEEP